MPQGDEYQFHNSSASFKDVALPPLTACQFVLFLTLHPYKLKLQGRIKVGGNRRPPTRTARRLAVEELDKNEINTAENACLPILKGNSGPPTILHNSELQRKKNTEKACLVPSTNSSNQPNESKGSPLLKSTAYSDVNDLFESNNLFTKDSNSKATLEAKGIVSQAAKSEELFPAAQGGTSCDDLFHSRKTLRKLSPVPFPEEEQDVFITSKKTVKRKEPELPSQLHQSFPIEDIFEVILKVFLFRLWFFLTQALE